jgi:hypothetical protein
VKALVRGGVVVVGLVYGIGLLWPDVLERAPAALQPVLLVLVVVGAVVDVVFLSSEKAWAWWRRDDDGPDR